MTSRNNIRNSQTCSACGTSIVNHRLLLILSILEESIGAPVDRLLRFTHEKHWQKLAVFVEKVFLSLLALVKVARFSKDIEKSITGRSKLIWEEALKRGLEMEQVILLGKPIEFYRARISEGAPSETKVPWFYFQSLPIPPSLNQSGYTWLDNKFILFETLSRANIPAPKSIRVRKINEAKEAFGLLKKPVILKPNFGSRGRHTTTNITTEKELLAAFKLAKEITSSMVIQEHLFGSVYRATVINDKLVGFFRADPPRVTGDGAHNIRELIKMANDTRHERLSEILINNDLVEFLDRQNYTLESIPPTGTIVNLSAKTGRMYGGYTEEMLPKVHPKMHSMFARAGELMSAPVLGFDLIIGDPTQDPDTEKWGIIECNSLPYIDLHYFALVGTPINLAENVWDLWNTNTK